MPTVDFTLADIATQTEQIVERALIKERDTTRAMVHEVVQEEIKSTVPGMVQEIIQDTVPGIVRGIIQSEVPGIVEGIMTREITSL